MSRCRATFCKLNMVDCLRRPASFDQLSDKISRLESLQVERQNSSFILQDIYLQLEFFETGDPPFCNQVQVQKIFNFFVYILVTSLRNQMALCSVYIVQLSFRQFQCGAAAAVHFIRKQNWSDSSRIIIEIFKHNDFAIN